MDYKLYIAKLWYKIIYLFVVIIYLFHLNNLNQILLAKNMKSPIALLTYDDCIAFKYFIVAVILFSIGCFLGYREIKKLISGIEDFDEIIIAIITIIVVGLLLLLIYVFIDNPIFRAVLIVVLTAFGIVYASMN